MLKLGLVEDNPYLGGSLSQEISSLNQTTVSFWAKNGIECLELLKENKNLDAILMDIQMPKMDGISTTREVKSRYPHIKVVMLTVLHDDQNIFKAIQAGASGYLLKDTPVETLIEKVQEMLQGGAPMSPSIATRTLELLRNPTTDFSQDIDVNLTVRETEVLLHLSKGLTYQEIAENLIISPKTVRKHIENIYQKLNVHSKLEAVNKAKKFRLF